MKTLCCIGHYGGGLDFYDGQTIKTKNLYEGLEKYSNNIELTKLDTFQWIKNPFKFFIKIIATIKFSDIIIVSVAINGLRILIPLIALINIFYRKRIHYFEIGGAVRRGIKFNKVFEIALKSLTSINLENCSNVSFFKEKGFNNVFLVRNFKFINMLKVSELSESRGSLNLIYFARVEKYKGILEIVKAVRKINDFYSKEIFELDIYGAINADFKEEFFDYLKLNNCKSIRYLGIVSPHKSTEIIKKYFMLVFPTKYFDEGIPGTLIDSLFAGVPILSSRYGTYREVVIEGVNGITYNFNDGLDLFSKLKYAYEHQDRINFMKKNCLQEANKFLPEKIMKDFLKRI